MPRKDRFHTRIYSVFHGYRARETMAPRQLPFLINAYRKNGNRGRSEQGLGGRFRTCDCTSSELPSLPLSRYFPISRRACRFHLPPFVAVRAALVPVISDRLGFSRIVASSPRGDWQARPDGIFQSWVKRRRNSDGTSGLQSVALWLHGPRHDQSCLHREVAQQCGKMPLYGVRRTSLVEARTASETAAGS